AADEALSLFRRGQAIWTRRSLLERTAEGAVDSETSRRIRADLSDLAIICADLRVHGEPGKPSDDALRDAVQMLREAQTELGDSPALSRDLQSYAAALGQGEAAPAPIPTPQTAWEHYDLGRFYLRSGQYARGEAEFRRASDLEPQEFWPNFF